MKHPSRGLHEYGIRRMLVIALFIAALPLFEASVIFSLQADDKPAGGGMNPGSGTTPGGEMAGAAVPADPAADVIEELETIEYIEEVTPLEEAPLGLMELFGRLHPAMVHFPIAWLFLALLLQTGIVAFRRETWTSASTALLILLMLSFAPAVISGFLTADRLPDDADLLARMRLHRNLNLFGAGFAGIALLTRAFAGDGRKSLVQKLILLLLLVAAAFVMYSGHLGGKMVFGDGYLPF